MLRSLMPWLLNLLYAALLTLLSPVIIWRMIRHRRYRRGLRQKLFGQLPFTLDTRPLAWFHAVSVGEIVQLRKIVDEFRRQTSDSWTIVVSTSTDTGYDLARQRFPDCQLVWFPLDFSWAVRRALQRLQPSLLVLVELELWPGLILECSRQNVPVAIVNARLSHRSFRRYLRARWFLQPVFSRIALVAAQSQPCAERLQKLGVPAERIQLTGSVKFDGVACSPGHPPTQQLRSLLQIDPAAPVLMAGSTQAPEERWILDIWQQLRRLHPTLQLILVPRHRERFDEVAELVRAAGVPLLRRSQLTANPPPADLDTNCVRLLDTIGELSACWGLADMAFVGGSFGSRGGQNMIEPAAFGAAVTFGPNTWNFRDVVQIFREADACRQVQSPSELLPLLQHWLDQPLDRQRIGAAAAAVVLSQQGAVTATAQLLLTHVTPRNAIPPRIKAA
ncbi:MAG: 3-deoxy-D-manno-octulosonic acid transferase [Planctomycetota bacterium]